MNMEQTRLIHDYLDGELEASQQDLLFKELANNSELRHEFNSQLKIHTIVKNDLATVNAPVETTNAIFSQLGFHIPPTDFRPDPAIAADLARHTGGWATAVMLFLKKYTPQLMSTIFTAGLTALLVYYLMDRTGGERIVINGNNPVPVVLSAEGPLYPTATAMPDNGMSRAEMKRIIDESLRNYMTQMTNNYNENIKNFIANYQAQNPQSRGNEFAVQRDNMFGNGLSVHRNSDLIANRPQYSNSPSVNNQEYNNALPYIPIRSDYNTKFNLSLRGITSKGNPDVTVPVNSNTLFNNVGLGLSYNLSDYHTVGIEAGKEAYPQAFSGTNYTERLKYQQNYSYFWYGATYKLSLSEMFVPKVFFPYAQVFGGATTVGPLARATVGLQYRPDKRVTFSLGAEGSVLYYNYQGNLYNSQKYGLTYGVSINY